MSRNRLEHAIEVLRVPATVVRDAREADIVLTLKNYFRQRAQPIRDAETRGIPVYVLRSNTGVQMEQLLSTLFPAKASDEMQHLGRSGPEQRPSRRVWRPMTDDPLLAAISEAEEAISSVIDGGPPVQLAPQVSRIRQVQHQLAERYALASRSRGREPHRRVEISREASADSLTGALIALEGIEGSGKSTVAKRLVAKMGGPGRGSSSPGAGRNSDRRADSGRYSSARHRLNACETEMLLFAAARAQHVGELIRPALPRGAIVVTDRFSDSSLAYQWGGRGLRTRRSDVQDCRLAGSKPDLKILLDLPVETAHGDEWPTETRPTEWIGSHCSFTPECATRTIRCCADPARWRVVDAPRRRRSSG